MSRSPLLRATHVARAPHEAFALFTDRIGAWWPLPTHGLFGVRSAGVAFVDGRLVERSVDGDETVWGEVTSWEPPHRLAFSWHPGRAAPTAGDGAPQTQVVVRFVATDDGTRVELEHRGWETFAEKAEAARRSYVGPNAWGYVLDHYADVADRVAGDRADDPGTEQLRAGYEALFAEALAGGFADPPAGQWSAAHVVAHVAVNDDLLSAVCRDLIHADGGQAPRLDNAVSNDVAVLDRLVTAHDGRLPALIDVARARAEQVCTLLERLDADQLATLVRCHLVSDGEVMVDDERPWSAMQRIQATFHLPSHTEQLRALRTPGSPHP